MSKEKQIEGYGTDTEKELYRDIWEGLGIQDYADECIWKKARVENCALSLSKKGYRKQSEGEWEFEFTLDEDDFYKCSICGRQVVINGLCTERNPAKHCPYCHCGAKMKGGAE